MTDDPRAQMLREFAEKLRGYGQHCQPCLTKATCLYERQCSSSPAPRQTADETVSMDILNSVTVAGARAFWALKDLETTHEALRANVLTVVSDPHLAWDEARRMLMAALAVSHSPTPREDR